MEKYLLRRPEEKISVSEKDKVGDFVLTNCAVTKDSVKCRSITECKKGDNIMKRERKSSFDFKEILTKRRCLDQGLSVWTVEACPFIWRPINGENLKFKYTRIFTKETADYVFQKLEQDVKYFSGDLLKVKVFGKWHDIPRKQVSYGDPGLSYAFSGNSVPAVPWSNCKIIAELKNLVESVTGHLFNFVLVNRYKNGMDHMGEHRDDEKCLVARAPIASLSLGQPRDFIFRHKDARSKKSERKIDPVKIELEHGSLLLMEWPTNSFWYHSLPIRKHAVNARINLTFRQMVK